MSDTLGPFELNRTHCIDCLEAMKQLFNWPQFVSMKVDMFGAGNCRQIINRVIKRVLVNMVEHLSFGEFPIMCLPNHNGAQLPYVGLPNFHIGSLFCPTSFGCPDSYRAKHKFPVVWSSLLELSARRKMQSFHTLVPRGILGAKRSSIRVFLLPLSIALSTTKASLGLLACFSHKSITTNVTGPNSHDASLIFLYYIRLHGFVKQRLWHYWQTGRRFLGFEISPEYTRLANERCESARRQISLSDLRNGQGTLFG